jgi:addiction module RelE/StbE family toxin
LNISYSPQAAADLDTIHAFISQHSAAKADEYVVRILQAVRMLESFPLVGRPGRVETTRELVLPGMPYIAIYRIRSETDVEILTIKHGRQHYP